MFVVESYAPVRRFVFVEDHSCREVSRAFGLSHETVSKMCRLSLPPGYTRTKPVGKPKLGALPPVIHEIPMSDQAGPIKQRDSAKRIFERLREPFVEQGDQCKDVITGATGIGKMLFGVECRL